MASITIRRLDDNVKKRLRDRASRHGRSMEEEAREIFTVELAKSEVSGTDWVDSVRRRFAAAGYLDLPEAPRHAMREPPDFSGPEFGE